MYVLCQGRCLGLSQFLLDAKPRIICFVTPLFKCISVLSGVCNNAIDVMFVVDASRSVGFDNFQKQLDFMKELVQAYDIGPGPNQVQFGAITFDSKVYNQFNMGTFSNKTSLTTAISGIIYTEWHTHTYLALDYVRTNSFTTAAGYRPGVPNVAIVLTDGESSNPTATSRAAAALQASTTVIGIGVGPYAPVDQIKTIASGTGDENTYFLEFDDISTILGDLDEKICSAV